MPTRTSPHRSAIACLGAIIVILLSVSKACAQSLPFRLETRAEAAARQYGVSGRGVLIAILDRGIDWTNNDFRHPDGTTRIQYLYDLTDDTGAFDPGNPYFLGTIYTKAQVDEALRGGPPLATRDAVGHGTTTAGIAAGNGRNLPDRTYQGIAPDASLLVVKVVSDGAPAHDDQLAEEPFYEPERLLVAIDFVREKAFELGMPCVILLNLGSIGGPTDGTSELCRKIDATVGPGIPGLVFVTGTGDDGGMANHAGGRVVRGGSAPIQLHKQNAGPLFFDLWYADTDRFDVTIRTPRGTYGPYFAPEEYDIVYTEEFLYYHLNTDFHFFRASNHKREVWIRLDGPPGDYTIELQGASVLDGRFDATLNPSQFWNPDADHNGFLNYRVPGSLWDGASALHNIAPNSYVNLTSWTDIDGIKRSLTGQGALGDLWRGSSVGPTFDGRLGTDVSAPGDSVFTSYNPNSYWATFRFNLIQGGNGLYGRASAVSAASPIVTGIIALMLEKNPALDAEQVRAILRETARRDAFTGPDCNPRWGYGKVDAYAAVGFAGTARLEGVLNLDGSVNSVQPVSFEFRPKRGGEPFRRTFTLREDGSFRIDSVMPGEYDIALQGSKWLRTVVAGVALSPQTATEVKATLLPGDLNGDNVIELDDLVLFFDAYGSTPGDGNWNPDADLSCDDQVELDDLSLFFDNYGKEGDP